MGVICYRPAGDPVINSFRTTGPTKNIRGVNLAMNLSPGIQSLGITYQNNRVFCKYRRKLNRSDSFMADLNTDQFPIWEYRDQNNGPGFHAANERGFSDAVINLQFEPQVR